MNVLAQVKPSRLETLSLGTDVMSGTSLKRVLCIVPMIRKLHIRCNKVGDGDALVQVCATGTNLEGIFLHAHYGSSASDMQQPLSAVSLLQRILHLIRRHGKLKRVEYTGGTTMSELCDEFRDGVQWMRNRRMLVKCGKILLPTW